MENCSEPNGHKPTTSHCVSVSSDLILSCYKHIGLLGPYERFMIWGLTARLLLLLVQKCLNNIFICTIFMKRAVYRISLNAVIITM
jgi:hypothetical protein